MATLNSRCSVLAAANPKFGRFDRYKVLAEQIDLPAPIISRFDLIFVIEDKPSKEKDSELAEHILKTHQYTSIDYEIEPELLRKYIAYARKNVNPKLTDEANDILKEFYVSTRNSNPEDQGAVPITARQLEAIIRLAEASAKIKLKEKVEKEDAEKAVKLTLFCLRDVGVDPETGEMDADIVSGGTPKSDRDKIQRVTEEIKLLEEEFAGDAPLNVLLSNMSEKYGVSEDKTEQIVRNLKQKGVIYEPNAGYFRRVL
jgi:replicative DNA helicase Mcm